jgi:gliding motility-associated-like protein
MANCCRVYSTANITSDGNYMDLSSPPPPPPPQIGDFPPTIPSCTALTPGPVGNGIVNSIYLTPALGTQNSSPYFTSSADSILNVCLGNPFSFPLKAIDPDGDSIAYHFSTPTTFRVDKDFKIINGSSSQLFFKKGYSVNEPAGPSVKLDQKTGLITGSLPEGGIYDITVSVLEYRAGVMLDSVTQDFFIKSYDCSILPKPKAIIPDSLNDCNSLAVNFPDYSIPQTHGGYSYENTNPNVIWNFGDNDSSTEFAPVHDYADTGTYKVRLIVYPGLYCADTANAVAIVYPFVQAGFTYSDSCNGKPVPFINTSSSTSGAFTRSYWTAFKDTTLMAESTDYDGNLQFPVAPQTYRVFLTMMNDKGCVATDSQWVSIEKSPKPLSFHDTLLSTGASLPLSVDDGNSNFNSLYIWSPAYGLDNPFAPDPVLKSNVDMTYHVSVTNQFGCSMNDSFHVKYYTGPAIYVPNAFSPNGDGKNELFKPIYIGISSLKYFRVFTRYGQLVFETRQQLKGWDGRLNGDPAPEGAYIWEASGQDYLGKSQFQKGTVILIR